MCLPCTHVVHVCFSVLKSDRQAANYNKEVGHVSLLRVFDIGFKMSVYLKLTLSHSLSLSCWKKQFNPIKQGQRHKSFDLFQYLCLLTCIFHLSS